MVDKVRGTGVAHETQGPPVHPDRPGSPSSSGVIILRPAWAEPPVSGGDAAPDGPSRFLRDLDLDRWRRWWVSLLVAVLAVLIGSQLFWSHRGAWVGHNGDHYYYASTALQYAGMPYEESLRIATDYFDYPYSATQLDLGYLNPAVAPLIYPRVVLGLLALPAVDLLGVEGVWFPGFLSGSLSVVLLMVLAVRRVGRVGLLALPILIGVTRYAPEFMFGIYAEAPVILAAVLMLLAFPLGRARRTWWHALAAAGLVPLIMLSRQVPILTIGMVMGGWLWAWIGSRRFFNPWLPFALTIPPATVFSYWLLSVWAPYDAMPYLYSMTGSSNVQELMQALPSMWSVSVGSDWNELVSGDFPVIVLALLGLAGLVLVVRNPMAGVFLGSLGSGVATELLNGQPNSFRYFAPSLPVVLLLAALAISWLFHGGFALVARRVGLPVPDWPGAHLIRGQSRHRSGVVHVLPDGRMRISREPDPGPPPTRYGPFAAAVTAWGTVLAVLVGAVSTHAEAPMTAGRSERVSAGAFARSKIGKNKPWPFSAREGTLICTGDDFQMWFVTPDGTRYALSGTAMASSWAPRILDLAPVPPAYAWPELRPFLTEGMRLCGADRAYQSEAPVRREPAAKRP